MSEDAMAYKDGFKPEISIVIPVYNQAAKTVACMASIRASTTTPYEIIWVDNNSDDKNYTIIRKQATRPRVHCKLVRNPTNMGFIKATNLGIKESEGPIIILLNNDTEVFPGWEKRLIRPLQRDLKAGACGPVTQSKIAWQEAANLNRRWDLGLPPYDKNNGKYADILAKKFGDKYVDIGALPLSFFCCAIPRRIFNELGLLDENFSIGLGDDDEFCMRMRYAGYRLFLSVGVFVYHAHRTTFKELRLGLDSIRRHNVKVLRNKEKVLKLKYGVK